MPSSISPIGNSALGSVSNDSASRSNMLLSQAAVGNQDAFQSLRAGTHQLAPQEAMALLRRMAHPDPGDPLAASNGDSTWNSDQQKELISVFQGQSRKEPIQHLDGYLGELAGVPGDQQATSTEFLELRDTINHLPTPDALKFLARFEDSAHPNLHPDAFRLLKEELQDRAGVRVTGSRGQAQELSNFGDAGLKSKFWKSKSEQGNQFSSTDPANVDAYKAVASPLSASYGDGRRIFERKSHLNVPSLQVDKNPGNTSTEGRTHLAEFGARAYVLTASSIDPANMVNANQSFSAGAQAQGHLIHSKYTVKHEPDDLSLAGRRVLKPKIECNVDCFIGNNGDVRAGVSAGPYPAVQIQGSAFTGARADAQIKAKGSLLGHDIGEVQIKSTTMAGAEAAGTFSAGRVYDSIKGKPVSAGAELGGMLFAGYRTGVELGGDVAGIGGKLKGEAWAGIGVIGKLYGKIENGTIKFGGEHGAALGVGGSVSWGVSLNPGKLAKAFNKDLPGKIETSMRTVPGVVKRQVTSGAVVARDGLQKAGVTARQGMDVGIQGARNVVANAVTIAGAGAQRATAAVRSGANAASTRAQNLLDNGRQFSAVLRARILQPSRPADVAELQSPAAGPPDTHETTGIGDTKAGGN